jgi:chromosomal replication initiation ATPase DnaA
MTAIEMRRAKDQAHARLLNAVISYIASNMVGNIDEIEAGVDELHAACENSQFLLYPTERRG